jgi:hypothetical protein
MTLLVGCSSDEGDDDDESGGESGESSGGSSASSGSGGSSGSSGGNGGVAGGTTGGTGGTDTNGGTDATGGTAGTNAAGGTAGTDGGTGGNSGTGPSETGPQIVAFSTNVTSIEPKQSVTFTAIVIDADGIDNVIGGTLAAEASSRTYGAFVTAAAEGAYSLTLSWTQIQQATPLPDDSTEGKLTFEAKFFDAQGHSVTETVELELLCDDDGGDNVCCEGESVDTTSDDNHCGECANACGEYVCFESECGI